MSKQTRPRFISRRNRNVVFSPLVERWTLQSLLYNCGEQDKMRALTLVLHASENPEAVRTGATKGITMHGYPSKVELRHMTRQPLPAVPTELTGSLFSRLLKNSFYKSPKPCQGSCWLAITLEYR